MEKINQWCNVLYIISLTTGVLIHIIPDGKIKKCVNIVFSLIFLTTIASIFTSIDSIKLDVGNSYNNIKSYDYDLNSYITDAADKKVIEEIHTHLDAMCKFEYSVDTKWIQNDNTYQLIEIKISISKNDMYSTDSIKSAVSSLTGIIPEVTINDKNQ